MFTVCPGKVILGEHVYGPVLLAMIIVIHVKQRAFVGIHTVGSWDLVTLKFGTKLNSSPLSAA